jgi:hypothetical protein
MGVKMVCYTEEGLYTEGIREEGAEDYIRI